MKPWLIWFVVLVPFPVYAESPWVVHKVDSQADFRGLDVVSDKVIWVSGTRGTFCRTTDGGQSWSVGTVPQAEKLDFRDVEAFGEKVAFLMSAGPGEASRIYHTTDGGKTWELQFQASDPETFLDGIAFWDEQNGLAFGDPVKGTFQLWMTDNAGKNWKPVAKEKLPAALPKEAAFAASGTSLIVQGDKTAWFATGGGKVARLFLTTDRGQTWKAIETPLQADQDSSGIFAIHFRDADHGLIVGGDYRQPESTKATAAWTEDGGKTWTLLDKVLPYRSGVAWSKNLWIAVGISGSSRSDDGKSWSRIDGENYNSVGFAPSGDCWAVGPKGRIAKLPGGK